MIGLAIPHIWFNNLKMSNTSASEQNNFIEKTIGSPANNRLAFFARQVYKYHSKTYPWKCSRLRSKDLGSNFFFFLYIGFLKFKRPVHFLNEYFNKLLCIFSLNSFIFINYNHINSFSLRLVKNRQKVKMKIKIDEISKK